MRRIRLGVGEYVRGYGVSPRVVHEVDLHPESEPRIGDAQVVLNGFHRQGLPLQR